MNLGLHWEYWLRTIVGGDYPDDPLKLHQVVARAFIVFIAGLIIVRLGKSRGIGRMTPLDVLFGFMLGSVLSRGITGNAALSATIAASAALAATHWLLTRLTCRQHWFGNLIKGRASVIVKDGHPLSEDMLRHHISLSDLEEYARMKGIDDISQIRLAYKERNGEVSVIPKKPQPRVTEVVVADGVQTVRIQWE